MTLFAMLAMQIAPRLAAQEQGKEHTRYKLVEIGTFGGHSSGFVGVGAHSVNNRGVATGGAETAIPDPYAPNCFFSSDCLVAHTFRWQNGVLTDLGRLPGVNGGGPNDINANGVVTGISENGAIDPLTGFPEVRAVVWKDGGPFGKCESWLAVR